ncbi:alpha/beta hydrolase [Desulfobotulus sp. H1]|uniref:Alpha/beta hydrolase n=1 Tax=Desulfobotulus pelophilus TaxID=2823377 RepID=A0ABT3NDX3_9BACT|nr:alpha/beta hydrolase [Desulfobotulus pelophilus]MCW7755386.1 alpha/beta hydrolase [Desulfobotulus pelophilus]
MTNDFQDLFFPAESGDLHMLQGPARGKNSLFFLHGNSLCAAAYLPMLNSLYSYGYGFLAADIRGHGLSTREGTLPLNNWKLFIDDLALILQKNEACPITAIGHSMGGFFIYAAAARFPELFSRIILLDPVIFPARHILLFRILQTLKIKNGFSLPRKTRKKRNIFPDRESAERHYKGKGMFRLWHQESLHGFLSQGLRASSENGYELSCMPELEARFYESVPMDTWHYARRISCPVHIIRGENSHLFSEDAALRLTREIPFCTLETLPRIGHFFPLEEPKLCARHIHKVLCRSSFP